ncbi:MAG: 50S ribosomal protein L21, partial [Gemmatimonadota bacterium]
AERDEQVMIGQPSLEGASVSTEVVRHGRGEKIIVYKMKRRKGYRKKQGHRQGFTEIRVVDIDLGTGRSVKRGAKAEKLQADTKKTAETAAAAKAEKPSPKKTVEAESKTAGSEAVAAVDATDTARSLAEENGIDLSTIVGTGKEGRILKSDVAKAIKEREGN